MRNYALLFLAFLLLLAGPLIPAPAFAGNPWVDNVTSKITVATDNVLSAAVLLPKNVSRIAIYVPTITSAAISLVVSADGVTYKDLYCEENGTNTIIWSTAASTGDRIVEVPCNMYLYRYLKVKAGAGQAADRYFGIYGVGAAPPDPR